MAGNINLSNQQWLVKSFDSNKNGIMDELKVDPQVRGKVDTDNDGQVTQGELLSAIKSDAAEINKGTIVANRGGHIYTEGLETLKNVRSTAQNLAIPPRVFRRSGNLVAKALMRTRT